MVTTRRDLFFEARTAIPERNSAFEARELLLRALSISREEYYLHPSLPVTDEEEARFRALLARRLEGMPLAYLLGEWDFYGRTFTVTPGVLIPRPETEELVEEARNYLSGKEKVLDLCTGSGCVGITLALELPELAMTLGDVSDAALAAARENAKRYPAANVRVLYDDALAPSEERYDMIVCNPPYVALSDPLSEEVARHEPALALFGGEDGLDFYRAILRYRLSLLPSGGRIVFECGETQSRKVAHILETFGAKAIRIRTDLSGKGRIVSGERP